MHEILLPDSSPALLQFFYRTSTSYLLPANLLSRLQSAVLRRSTTTFTNILHQGHPHLSQTPPPY